MDPEAALRNILDAIKDGGDEDLIDQVEVLAGWMATGGFEPDWRRVFLEVVGSWEA